MRNPLIALAAVAVLAGTPALAENSTSVTYRDLDLTTEQGQKELDRRVDAAARQVCGANTVTTGTRLRSPEAQACHKQAFASVHAAIASRIEKEKLGG